MALSPVYTAVTGDTITAARWNNEFLNIYNNGTDVAFPLTKAVSFGSFAVTSAGDFTFTAGKTLGGSFILSTPNVGPHAIGGATDANTNLRLYGTLTRAFWASGGDIRFDNRLLFSSGAIAATSGTSVSGSAATLYFVGGTTSTDFNNNANAALLMRLTDAGILLTGGATQTTGATIGDSVSPNGKGPRGVSGAGTNTWSMVSVDANNVVQLGDNTNGAFVAITRGAAVAASANYKGVLIMDTGTAGQLDFYDGVTGARYKLTGTAF